jgi:hypothetical protein
VNFTDDRVYPFWHYPDESIIYWDKDRGTHTWKGGVASDCVDYNPGKIVSNFQMSTTSLTIPSVLMKLLFY